MAYNNNPTPGFTFSANNTSLTIFAGELYGSTQGNGIVDDNSSGNTLTNNGTVLSGLFDGVVFGSGSNDTVINNADASIIGKVDGMDVGGDGDTVTNSGTVMGLTNNGVE